MKYTITIDVEAKGEFTEDDVKKYIEFTVGYRGDLEQINPFIDEDESVELEVLSVEIERA
jgi:hypothetical protein